MDIDLATQLISAIQSRAWWPVVGVLAAVLVQVFRAIAPSVWDSMSTARKPIPALVVVAVAALADAFLGGQTWQVALVMVPMQIAAAWPTALGTADAILRLSGSKAPSVSTLERQATDMAAKGPQS